MKYSLSSPFARLTLLLLAVVFGVTIAGRFAANNAGSTSCGIWLLCIPDSPSAWIFMLHRFMAVVAAGLMLAVLRKAWREYRREKIVLPLTTITAVLLFGQAFVGAMQVLKGFPNDLVVLHAVTVISLWFSLAGLMFVSGSITIGQVDLMLPPMRQRLKDFLALNKPWIVALLLVTTFAGLVVGGKTWPPFWLAVWTLLGGALAAGGSSALNQYIDRELDRSMQRTAKRPLAAARLTPAEGLAFGLALCLASYYILAALVNFLAALLALAGIIYYVVLYSLWLKKATVQNIVIGGGAGAIPPMVGWAAATGELSLTAWILFAIVFMWTPPHFWALAIVRMKDYANAGVPMMPVVKGEVETRKKILVYTMELILVTLLLPLFDLAGSIYLVSAVALGGFLLYAAWRVWLVGGNKAAWTMYRWSSMYLAFIFLALVVDAVV